MLADVTKRSVSPGCMGTPGRVPAGAGAVSTAGTEQPAVGTPTSSSGHSSVLMSRFQVKIGDEWKDSEASEDKLLKQLLRDGHETVKITLRGQRLEYDFRALEQRNISRGTVRPIRLPKDWVGMEEWAEDRRAALAQPGGGLRSGAAAPPPTPRADSPSALARHTPHTPPAPRTPPPEPAVGMREASRRRARSPWDSPHVWQDTLRQPQTSPRRRRPTRECCLAVAGMMEEQRRRASLATASTPDRRPTTARAMSLSARLTEVTCSGGSSCRKGREERLSARVAELEAALARAVPAPGAGSEPWMRELVSQDAVLHLQRLEGLTARTQQLEERFGRAQPSKSPASRTCTRPKLKPPDAGKGPEARAAAGVPAVIALQEVEQDQINSAYSSSFATSDSDEPTQRGNAASQAGLLSRLLSLEAQLAASRAENEQLNEMLARSQQATKPPAADKVDEEAKENVRCGQIGEKCCGTGNVQQSPVPTSTPPQPPTVTTPFRSPETPHQTVAATTPRAKQGRRWPSPPAMAAQAVPATPLGRKTRQSASRSPSPAAVTEAHPIAKSPPPRVSAHKVRRRSGASPPPPERDELALAVTPLQLKEKRPFLSASPGREATVRVSVAATPPPRAKGRSSMFKSASLSPGAAAVTPMRSAYYSCAPSPEQDELALALTPLRAHKERLSRLSGPLRHRSCCQRCRQCQALGRIYLPAWRGHYLSLPKTPSRGDASIQPSFDDSAPVAAEPTDELSLDGTPAPPMADSWDWPLSRQERKERATFLDRQLLMADQRSLMEHIEGLRGGVGGGGEAGSRGARSSSVQVPSLAFTPSIEDDPWED